jgi:hypothetical protein
LKIWSRRSEWDYSWTDALKSPAEVILCSIYEHSRYALQCLLEGFSLPSREGDLSSSALPHLLAAARTNILGPIYFLWAHCPACFNFPFDPYRVARTRVRFDPETALHELEEFCAPRTPDDIRLPINADRDTIKGALTLAQITKRHPQPAVKRGAGARVRQARAALKNLGALKLLEIMTAPEAIGHTEEALGQPLFGAESQWSRARKQAKANLGPYHAEATALMEAWSEKRSLSEFSYLGGKLDVDWTDS